MRLRLRFFILLLICVGIVTFRTGSSVMRAQGPAAGPGVLDLERDDRPETNYIIVRTADGTACRPMSREEAESSRMDRGRDGLRELSPVGGVPSRVASAGQTGQTGLKIILRGTSQLESNATAKAAFLRAAAFWESVILTPITVVIDVDFGSTRFGTPYPSSNVIGSTSGQTLGLSDLYSSFRSRLIDNATTSQQLGIFNALPVGALPTELGSTTAVFTSSAVLRALGFISSTADPGTEAANYGPPPSIGFNSNFPFDFDPSNGVDFDKIDFNATAVHEIGHFLGFTSYVGQNELSPSSVRVNVWDFYRFRPGVNSDNFATAPRLMMAGDEHAHFAGLNESGLSTARLDGQFGDGRQAPHWKDDSLTGELIGIMDPTAANGTRDEISAQDLLTLGHFGYQINPGVTVTERLGVDDNSINSFPVVNGALAVNRLTPSRYPARVRSLLVRIPFVVDQPTPGRAPLRIVVFGDPGATGRPPANPQFLYDQTVTIPAISSGRFVEFTIDGPLIESGDFYVGVQSLTTPVGIAIDTNGVDAKRSFVSQNNGVSFQPLNTLVGGTGSANLMVRTVVSFPLSATPVPVLSGATPSVLPIGGVEQKVYLRGTGFQPGSVARINGSDRSTRYLSGSLLEATLTGADLANAGSAALTVWTGGSPGIGSTALTLTIGLNNPTPAITRLDPPGGALGSEGGLINIYGSNFTPLSRVRLGGVERSTGFVSSLQLTMTLQAADLAQVAPLSFTVSTPTPGGGISNEAVFTVAACTYSLSTLTQSFTSTGGANGVTLTTSSQVCPWNVTSDSSWLSLIRPGSATGTGKYAIYFSVARNEGTDARVARLVIGGQTMTLRQAGQLTSVSAASYSSTLSPEGIVVGFGTGLAKATQVVTALPLPTSLGGTSVSVRDSLGVSRTAALFYVSPQQVNYLSPAGTAAGAALVSLSVDGVVVATGSVTVTSVAPSLFSANSNGKDVAAANLLRVRADSTQVYEQVATYSGAERQYVPQPIDFGPAGDRLFLVLFGSGIRGRSAPGAVTVRIADLDIKPDYAGAQPSFVGLDQINFEIPRSLKGRGLVTIYLTVDGKQSNQVTVNIL